MLCYAAFLSSLRTNLQIATVDEVYSPSPLSMVHPASPGPTLPVSEKYNKFPIDPTPVHPKTYEPSNDKKPSARHNNCDEKKYDSSCSACSVTTFFTKKDGDVAAALRLIAGSVSQQRQTAVKTIVCHPYVVAVSTLLFLTSLKMLYTGSPSDLVLMMAVWIGYSLPGLLIVRYLVRGYDHVARNVGSWSWLSESSVSGVSHKRDEVLVAQHGNEIVGVLVLRMAKTMAGAGTPGVRTGGIRSRRKSSARWTGIIRAWTVRETDRGQGIGTRLLEEAVSNCRIRSFDGPILAEDHANATRILPRVFNSVFEKQEAWARSVLELAIVGQRGR